jgi:hypothetical protein
MDNNSLCEDPPNEPTTAPHEQCGPLTPPTLLGSSSCASASRSSTSCSLPPSRSSCAASLARDASPRAGLFTPPPTDPRWSSPAILSPPGVRFPCTGAPRKAHQLDGCAAGLRPPLVPASAARSLSPFEAAKTCTDRPSSSKVASEFSSAVALLTPAAESRPEKRVCDAFPPLSSVILHAQRVRGVRDRTVGGRMVSQLQLCHNLLASQHGGLGCGTCEKRRLVPRHMRRREQDRGWKIQG